MYHTKREILVMYVYSRQSTTEKTGLITSSKNSIFMNPMGSESKLSRLCAAQVRNPETRKLNHFFRADYRSSFSKGNMN